ncbi:Voltage-gated Ion Channel [Phytophthora cinnamomi]|uniref:Voltage-gated Ion Channel n=1 Tax=Phytophthora cinnamomi TaxID=4785 RepID=UPI0035598CC5|nr:Voltage-gated Ion Channel [Phytophthora cinnamomi]
MQPIVNHNEFWIVFFIAFMVVGSFFVMNVFVGVVIDNFNTIKAKLGGDFLLTPEQKKWMETQQSAKRIGPIRILKPPPQRVRRLCFTIVQTHYFERFIMSCILVNTLLMGAHHFGASTQQLHATTLVSDLNTCVFAVEAAMKLMAYGRAYFEDRWNQFDLFVVVGTLVGTVVQAFASSSVWTLTMVVRLTRVARIFRLVESSSSIRAILSTLYISLPGLGNITSILFLILFVYSTMGVQLFAKVALSSDIDTHANFQSLAGASSSCCVLQRASRGTIACTI